MPILYFLTGFPGFIATRLVKKLLNEQPAARFELLVHPSQLAKATQELLALNAADRCTLLSGDITAEHLALPASEQERLQGSVTHVFHLAALYDLAVPQDLAYRVNVIGTEQVNAFVRTLKQLRRYVYFSTAYVSGERTGPILETDLACGQRFKNHYEATKYEAELLVQAQREDVPTTIIRPGIVMGDSRTGETAKFDGPYFIMRFLDRFRRFPIPYIGPGDANINLVPIDYIIDATAYLAHADAALDRVYHLTNPSPVTARQTYEWICRELLGKSPSWELPAGLVEASLSLSAFRRWVRVERETIAYFHCLADYDCTGALQDLAPAGIHCPELSAFVGRAISFYKQHRHDPDKMIQVR